MSFTRTKSPCLSSISLYWPYLKALQFSTADGLGELEKPPCGGAKPPHGCHEEHRCSARPTQHWSRWRRGAIDRAHRRLGPLGATGYHLRTRGASEPRRLGALLEQRRRVPMQRVVGALGFHFGRPNWERGPCSDQRSCKAMSCNTHSHRSETCEQAFPCGLRAHAHGDKRTTSRPATK